MGFIIVNTNQCRQGPSSLSSCVLAFKADLATGALERCAFRRPQSAAFIVSLKDMIATPVEGVGMACREVLAAVDRVRRWQDLLEFGHRGPMAHDILDHVMYEMPHVL